jgi:hypothetical protein
MKKHKPNSPVVVDKSGACPYCSGPTDIFHYGRLCPKIKSVEYYSNGKLKKVEFRDENVRSG